MLEEKVVLTTQSKVPSNSEAAKIQKHTMNQANTAFQDTTLCRTYLVAASLTAFTLNPAFRGEGTQ